MISVVKSAWAIEDVFVMERHQVVLVSGPARWLAAPCAPTLVVVHHAPPPADGIGNPRCDVARYRG